MTDSTNPDNPPTNNRIALDPTKTGHRILTLLVGGPHRTAALVSELREHPLSADNLSEISVRRTLRGLRETGLIQRRDDRRWTITPDGAAVERAAHVWHIDNRSTHRLALADPPRQRGITPPSESESESDSKSECPADESEGGA